MIFPEESLDLWLEKYPDLKMEEGSCNFCGTSMKITRPFIERHFIGLVSPSCSCEKNTNEAMTMIPRSREEIEYWNLFLGREDK
jgi:hypothetical protein